MNTRLSGFLVGAAVAAGLAFISSTASAQLQMISGRLVKERLNTPVAEASIQLLSSTGRELDQIVRSNKSGVFTLYPEPGRYRLKIRCIGCVPIETAVFEVAPKAAVEMRIEVAPVAARLASVKVSERSNLETGRVGMAKRCVDPKKAICLYKADIREKVAEPLYKILGSVEGLRETLDGDVESLKGHRCLQFMINRLPIRAVPDSKLWGAEQFGTLYEMIPDGYDIAGIEVYKQFSDVPVELRQDAWPYADAKGVTPVRTPRTIGSSLENIPPCGLVNIWTTRAW